MSNRSRRCVAVTFGLIGTLLLHGYAKAADEPLDLSSLPELGTRELNSGGPALVVTAGTEKKTAYFRFGNNPISSNILKWDIAVEAPYDEDNGPSVPADFDGLNNSTTIQANISGIWIFKPKVTNEFRAEMDNLCSKYLGKTNHQGGAVQEICNNGLTTLHDPRK